MATFPPQANDSQEDVPRTWLIYVGPKVKDNFAIGRVKGVWGTEIKQRFADITEGDHVLFLYDVSPNRPVTSREGWPRTTPLFFELVDTAELVVRVRVTSNVFSATTPIWPQARRRKSKQRQAEDEKLYPHRFTFEEIAEREHVPLRTFFSAEALDTIRLTMTTPDARLLPQSEWGYLLTYDSPKPNPPVAQEPEQPVDERDNTVLEALDTPHTKPTEEPAHTQVPPVPVLGEATRYTCTRQPVYSLDELVADTGLSRDRLQLWVSTIKRKGQAILYGPPGTGKTYVAERLARHLLSEQHGFSDLVQFHPAYAYEDFVEGIRPVVEANQAISYRRVPGLFRTFCDAARRCDGRAVLIIDEINRANLARVFGELMYLLEYRDRNIRLAGGETFAIPRNVLLIGTMNTADRSIALVDHALRRRFAFLPLSPAYEALARFLEQHAPGFPATVMVNILKTVNKQIREPDYQLGTSFFMVKGLDLGQLQAIWQMEIEPYLDEYFIGQDGLSASSPVSKLRWSAISRQFAGTANGLTATDVSGELGANADVERADGLGALLEPDVLDAENQEAEDEYER